MKIELPGGLLTVFIVLKLVHVITWSWVWVLCPLWLPIAVVGIIMLIAIIILGWSEAVSKL